MRAIGPEVQAAELVSALEGVAARLGIPVRYEVMDPTVSQRRTSGGLVRLRGQAMILVDAALGPSDRAAILARALRSFDLESMYLAPFVRAAIRADGDLKLLEPRPLARARPSSRRDDEDDD